jgi:hypothetical protein
LGRSLGCDLVLFVCLNPIDNSFKNGILNILFRFGTVFALGVINLNDGISPEITGAEIVLFLSPEQSPDRLMDG